MNDTRRYLLESVDDAAVVQLYADGFTTLDLRHKILVWHLYLAAIAGRDIYYDQRYAHNLEMRAILEGILTHSAHVEPRVLDEIRRYTKLFWINTGPYNNLTARKFVLQLTRAELLDAAVASRRDGAVIATRPGETLAALVDRLAPMFFDADVDPILTNKTPGNGRDILEASSNNLYAGVTMGALEGFHERYALNSRLTANEGRLVEDVYRVGGLYDREIRHIIRHLSDAVAFAPPRMADALTALIRFYETGEEADRIAYDIAWVRDQESPVDTINGFIEVYLDPRGVKGAWEGMVCYVNPEKTRRIHALAAHAQWFEDHMPWDPRFRKTEVTGVTARAIEVVIETGDSGPVTPIGINLPNDQAIREQYGSKSVSLANVSEAYERSTPEGLRLEFSWDDAEAARAKRWGAVAQELTTDMHEVIGHGSGRMADEVTLPPHRLLAEQYSSIEEARADLVALYFLADREIVELGLLSAEEHTEVVRTEYRVLHANGARAAAARARGFAPRRRSHAQPPDDCALAARAHLRHRHPATRRQDVLRDDGRRGVSPGRGAAACRGAADQERGRLRSGAAALRGVRRALRFDSSGRSGRACGSAEAALVYRIRDAAARGQA